MNSKPSTPLAPILIGSDFFDTMWEKSWTYIKTVVDVMREPILILDKDFKVMAANEPFYQTFQVEAKATEGKVIYKLGNGQWDIPSLRRLLETVLPQNTFFKGFQVAHEFPIIGRKVMILNAREIHFAQDHSTKKFPSIILLAIEDVTDMMAVAETFASHTQRLDEKFSTETKKIEQHVKKLEKEILALKLKDGNKPQTL